MTLELGCVEFYVAATEVGVKYEITVLQFRSHSEILRMIDSTSKMPLNSDVRYIKRGSSEWFAVHSLLSKEGKLKGRRHADATSG